MLVSDLRYNDFASRIQALRSSTAKTLFEHHRASAIAMLDQSIALARQRYGDHSDLESTQETSAAPNWTVVKKVPTQWEQRSAFAVSKRMATTFPSSKSRTVQH